MSYTDHFRGDLYAGTIGVEKFVFVFPNYGNGCIRLQIILACYKFAIYVTLDMYLIILPLNGLYM